MKILFERNERLKELDAKIYINSLDELENLKDKDVWLLKDDRTQFKAFKEGFVEDVRSVFILVASKEGDFKIKIKGNLSFFGRDSQVKFYPVFVNQYGNFHDHKDFLYKFDVSKLDDGKLNRFDREKQNETVYKEMLSEFKNTKYTPVAASKEWQSFIEPYEYYVDLKFQLVKQNFLMMKDFDKKTQKIILLSRKDKMFNDFYENKLYDHIIEDNRNMLLVVDYDNHKNNFSREFLNKHTYHVAKSIEKVTKDRRLSESNDMEIINSKLKRNLSKSTFFTTENVYTANDLKKDGSISKKDIEIEADYAFYKPLKDDPSIVDIGTTKLLNYINNIKKIDSNIESINDVNILLSTVDNQINVIKNIDQLYSKVKKDLSSKIKNIEDESVDFVNELVSTLGEFEIPKSIIDLSMSMKLLKDRLSEIINDNNFENNREVTSLEDRKKSKIESISNDLKEKQNILKEKGLDKDDKNRIEKEIDELNSSIKAIEIQFDQELESLNAKLIESNNFVVEEFKPLFDKEIKSYTREIELFKSAQYEVYDFMQSGIVRTVEYIKEFNILFNYKAKSKDNFIHKNFYLLNTGDMVLVDTIRRINTKIKHGHEVNNEILEKIIRKTKLRPFNDAGIIDPRLEKFVPASYNGLNESQQKAFRLAIDKTDSISIIQGPPGTGKTEVITNIIKYFRNKGEKVILSSQTNVALKNVLDKLCSKDKVENSVVIPWLTTKSNESYSLRNISTTWYDKFIGNLEVSNSPLIDKWESKLDELKKDEDILQEFSMIRDAKIYAATTTTSVTLPKRGYDKHLEDVKVLIIDEVSKSILPEILRYALDVEKVILVGDYKQLNPIFDINKDELDSKVDSKKFDELKSEIQAGVFYQLAKDAIGVNRLSTLDVNYRSVPGVLDAYNVFYSGKNGNGLGQHRSFDEYENNYKYSKGSNFDSKHSLYFFDVRGTKEEKRGTSRYNVGELETLVSTLRELGESLIDAKEKDVAIIFPYAAQINAFSNYLKRKENSDIRMLFKSVEWDTVDSFQGSEADIVFLSTVVTDAGSRNFLSDFRRVNVSMSRAKDMLVIFGNGIVIKQLEISGDGIVPDKYFAKILDDKENKYLKNVRVNWKEGGR